MGDRKKEVWRGLRKQDMAFRCTGLDGDDVWNRDLRKEREGNGGEDAGEIFEIDTGVS